MRCLHSQTFTVRRDVIPSVAVLISTFRACDDLLERGNALRQHLPVGERC